jgi:hypothetical protein
MTMIQQPEGDEWAQAFRRGLQWVHDQPNVLADEYLSKVALAVQQGVVFGIHMHYFGGSGASDLHPPLMFSAQAPEIVNGFLAEEYQEIITARRRPMHFSTTTSPISIPSGIATIFTFARSISSRVRMR